ncbi:MAG: hypothetical protein K940chlam3_01555 [Chlamydiae bacterium]|nr:hypothetical protein [Chlamydiota bacterium]
MIVNNKRTRSLVETLPSKAPRLLEIDWLGADELKERLGKDFFNSSFPERVETLRNSLLERVCNFIEKDVVKKETIHVIWLDFGVASVPVYVILEKPKNNSLFDDEETRQGLFKLKPGGVDVSVYSYAQYECLFERKYELKDKMKASMTKSSWPSLILKWDIEGKVLEVVWLQGSSTFSHGEETFMGINGKLLKEIVDLFSELLPPSDMTVMGDQAKRGDTLIRKYYPLIKPFTDFSYGPGYYGSWGFVPFDCWQVKPREGDPMSQSRDLYYAAVEYLRDFSLELAYTRILKEDSIHLSQIMDRYQLENSHTLHDLMMNVYRAMLASKTKADEDFQWILAKILVRTNRIREFDSALDVIKETQLWVKRPDEGYHRGYIHHLLFSDTQRFEKYFDKKRATYDNLVSRALESPKEPLSSE